MIPKRIIRFLYECFKYGLISQEILAKLNSKIFEFDKYAKEDANLLKCFYLFLSNVPYIFNSLIGEIREKFINKLIEVNNLLRNNPLKSKTDQYRNKGDFDYLENMSETYLAAAKENKLSSDFILEFSDLGNKDFEGKMALEDLQDEENIRNLNNLHMSLNHVFESDLVEKLNLEVKFFLIFKFFIYFNLFVFYISNISN